MGSLAFSREVVLLHPSKAPCLATGALFHSTGVHSQGSHRAPRSPLPPHLLSRALLGTGQTPRPSGSGTCCCSCLCLWPHHSGLDLWHEGRGWTAGEPPTSPMQANH